MVIIYGTHFWETLSHFSLSLSEEMTRSEASLVTGSFLIRLISFLQDGKCVWSAVFKTDVPKNGCFGGVFPIWTLSNTKNLAEILYLVSLLQFTLDGAHNVERNSLSLPLYSIVNLFLLPCRQQGDCLHLCCQRGWSGQCNESGLPRGGALFLWLQQGCPTKRFTSGLAVGWLWGQHWIRLSLCQGICGCPGARKNISERILREF